MFNNCDPKINGEERLYNSIKDKINVIFDVAMKVNILILPEKFIILTQ
jgi:hypothetical protein